MASKLIFKVEYDKQTKKAIKIDTDVDNWQVYFKEPFGEIVDWAIRISCYDRESKELLGEDKLWFLKTLIVLHNFKLNLTELENAYRLVVYKNTSSTSFETSKENKIETLFLQAEEWAQVMLEDYSTTNNI